jgi:hypothetical protein
MNRRLLELALKKQRLQFQSVALREQWANHALGLRPLCTGIDRVDDGFAWLRRYPHVFAAVGAALLAARPRALWRWTRRGWLAWQFWRRGGRWLLTR